MQNQRDIQKHGKWRKIIIHCINSKFGTSIINEYDNHIYSVHKIQIKI